MTLLQDPLPKNSECASTIELANVDMSIFQMMVLVMHVYRVDLQPSAFHKQLVEPVVSVATETQHPSLDLMNTLSKTQGGILSKKQSHSQRTEKKSLQTRQG